MPKTRYSTQRNDVASYEARLAGASQRGSVDPWSSMRTYQGPGQLLPPHSASAENELIRSSTAATDLESWTVRRSHQALRGRFNPNAYHRLGEAKAVSKPAPQVATEAPLDSSSASNDIYSWSSRLQGRAYTRGQVEPWAQTLTESQARQANQSAPKKTAPELSFWSTASVDTSSWEARVNKAYPDRLAFKSARGQVLLNTYIGQGYGFTSRKQ